MMISNAISTTMMTSRRSDRFVLMMSVSIFAVSEMTASLRDSGVGAFLELVFGDLTLVARQHRAFRKRVRNHDHAFWCNCLEQDRAPRQDLLVLVGNDLEGGGLVLPHFDRTNSAVMDIRIRPPEPFARSRSAL
jgi:hypothetical protein